MKLKLMEVKTASGMRINWLGEVYELMREEAQADRECSWVIHLNRAFYVIEKEFTGMGSLFSVNASPREIFKKAIINGAYAIIQVHNHPSGDLIPSNADIDAVKNLAKAGKILGIELYDCLIIGPTGYYSFLEATRRGEELVFACLHCGEELKEEMLVREHGLDFCPYCWEVYYGEKLESWIPKVLSPRGYQVL